MVFSEEEVKQATLEYFNGDELAANVWIGKYALRNEKGELLEKTPDDMHRRLAREFARIEAKYPNPLSEDEIYGYLKGFKHICVTDDTWVLTSDGAKQVKDLIGSPFIAVVDGKLYRSTREGFFKTGIQQVYEVKTKEGYSFKATEAHQVLTHIHLGYWLKHKKAEWRKVSELKVGDKLVLHDHTNNYWLGSGTEDEGWLLGNLLGDGTFGSDTSATLMYMSEERDEEAEYALSVLNKAINKYTSRVTGVAPVEEYYKISKSIEFKRNSIYSKGLCNLAEKFGMIKGNKIVTKQIEEASSDFYIGFLRGWFDADGCVYSPIETRGKSYAICLDSIDLDSLKAAQRMLARLGIISRIYKRRDAQEKIIQGRKANCKEQYALYISKDNIIKYAEIIGFTNSKKQERLKKMVGSEHFFRKERFAATIESITPIGNFDVYDCTVPEISAFDGNGFWLHNCPQGSPMAGIGNDYQIMSLSNCVVVDSPKDTMSSIVNSGRELANLFKRRCVSAESFVSTKQGPKRMKDIQIGDDVLSFNTKTLESEYKPVMDKFETEVEESDRIAIKTRNGATLNTSKKHPVLVFDVQHEKYEYKEAGLIKEGDILIAPERKLYNVTESTDSKLNDLGWFIGCHMGDGSCDWVRSYSKSNSKMIRFRCLGDNEPVIAEYARIANELLNSKRVYTKANRKDYKSDAWEYSNRNKISYDVAVKYLDGQVGSKTYTGRIPSFIKQNNLYLPFFAGLFDSDGYFKPGGTLDIAICAKEILDELATWLSSNGIRFHLMTYIPKRPNEKTIYKLQVQYNKEFFNILSGHLRHDKKREKVISYKNINHSKAIPLTKTEIEDITNRYWSILKEKKVSRAGDTISVMLYSLKSGKSKGAGEALIQKLLESNVISEQKYLEICQRQVVTSIAKSKEDRFFDIEVKDNNNFYSGNFGLVNIHNCGVGLDLSELRPEGAKVKNAAGSSTGAWSFADFYSYITRLVGQSGRRAALMETMDVRHPDIEKFVTMKQDLTKVTGANVSVRIFDEFMEAVEKDQDFTLRFPVDSPNPSYSRVIKARQLWNLIIECATKTAEPGLIMWDNVLKMLPANCYPDFKSICVNPCSELVLSAFDSCRLITLNIKGFAKNGFSSDAYFDFEEFEKTVRIGMRLSDDLVDLELEKLNKIREVADTDDEKELWQKLYNACKNGRRTGLGTHGLADAIACLGYKYDSDEGLNIIERIYKTLRDVSYHESSIMSKERGSFPVFDWNLEKDCEFIKLLPGYIQESMSKYGRRNISLLTNAPTGSVSILSQTSSGIEPVFRNFYIRRRKLSHNDDCTPDFIDELGDKWIEFKVFHHNVAEYVNKYSASSDNLPDFFVESDKINWVRRVEIQSVIQKYIDHSISSTINLPKGTPPEIVGELYMKAWKLGLKGVTVYVDGSRSGVLITEKDKSKSKDLFPQNDSPKRPEELPCDIHHLTVDGEDWVVLIGLMDGKPYEVMGGLSNVIEIPSKYESGILVKKSFKTIPARYDLKFGPDDEQILIKDVVKVFDNPNYGALTRMLSLAMRHGASINYVVEQLQKDKSSDMFSFSKSIARVLKKYIKDGTKVRTEKTCSECGEESLIYQDGCVSCSNCGASKCG